MFLTRSDGVYNLSWMIISALHGALHKWFSINGKLRLSWPNIFFFTHRGRDKMDAIFQTTFSSVFSWMKMCDIRLKFHWCLFLGPPLVQIMAWRRPGDKPLSEPMMFSLPTHICVTRPQWVIRCQKWPRVVFMIKKITFPDKLSYIHALTLSIRAS